MIKLKRNLIVSIFVPAIIFVSVVAFVWLWLSTGDLPRALATAVLTLVSACPCALGLAVPVPLKLCVNKAAENGIIFNNGKCFENARKLDVILLSKSGVVTEGRPEVTDVIAFPGFFEEEVVTFAAAAEKESGHPLGRAVYEYTQPKVIFGGLSENIVRSGEDELVTLYSERHGFIGSVPEPDTVEALPGYGVRAVVGGRTVLVGSRRLLADNGVDVRPLAKIISELEDEGKTAILVAIGRKAAGVIAASDTVEEGAREAVESLKSLGLEVYMLTGGSTRTAKAIGKQAGIDNVIAEILPQDKAGGITRLRDAGKTVAIIGGGASALKSADLGIATSPDADTEAADITLMRGGLNGAPDAIRISKTTVRIIKQNLFLSLIYNAIGILFVAAGLFPPVVMAAAMLLSSVSVAVNSLSLKRLKL